MKKISCLILFTMLTACCSLSMIQTDTHGTASDVVDDTLTPSTTVTPTVTIPVKP